MVIAVDHPARRILGVGDDPHAMADRRRLLDHTIRALRRPGVDGLLATADILEDLLLLGELDGKVLFGSMNRGGLAGATWELDDRFTGYDASTIDRFGLDGGKMLLRLDYDDPRSNETLTACATAVTALADSSWWRWSSHCRCVRDAAGRVQIRESVDALIEAVAVASGLGATSAYTWLKLPASADPSGCSPPPPCPRSCSAAIPATGPPRMVHGVAAGDGPPPGARARRRAEPALPGRR